MALPQAVIDFINESAQRIGADQPKPDEDLFRSGILDSFALIDFVSVLEEECGIKVSDADVNPASFRSIETIENYVAAHKG